MLTGLRNAGFAEPARTQTPRLAPSTDPAARTPTTRIVRSADAKAKRAERLRKLVDRDAPGSRAGAVQITSRPSTLATATPHAPGPAGVTPNMRTAIATAAVAAAPKPVSMDVIAIPPTKTSPTTRSPRAPTPLLKPGGATGPARPTPTPTPPPQQQQPPPQRGARSAAPSPAAAREDPSFTADGWKGLSMFHGKFAKRFTAREVLVEEEDITFHQPSA